MRIFALAFNIALGIVVIAWLHNPPLGYGFRTTPYERPAGQPQRDDATPKPSQEKSDGTAPPTDKNKHTDEATGGNREPEKGWWEKLWTDPNATFAMFVAFFTLGLLGLGCMQFRDSHLLQRAYLSVQPLGIRCRKNQPWFATVGIHNAGRLPARDLRWSIKIEPFPLGLGEDWKDFSNHDATRRGPVVPPGAVVRRSGERFSVDNRIHRLADQPEQFLYVWGEVTYTDGFGIKRFTRFCHRYNSHAIAPDAAGGFYIHPEDARYHDYGNEAT
jgi:hypothetical protein